MGYTKIIDKSFICTLFQVILGSIWDHSKETKEKNTTIDLTSGVKVLDHGCEDLNLCAEKYPTFSAMGFISKG